MKRKLHFLTGFWDRDDTDSSIPIWTQPESNNTVGDTLNDSEEHGGLNIGAGEPGSLICLTMDGEGQAQESLHSALVTMPQTSTVETPGDIFMMVKKFSDNHA